MKKILFPNLNKYINFSNPFNGRKWLNLLEPHIDYGILFKKKLNLKKDELGFTFVSNDYGLRGSNNSSASNVILGTSFAMGLSVDNGCNWYDTSINKNNWFNASMPVGIHNNISLINDIYIGDSKNLLYIYHPNIWKISRSFVAAKNKKKDIFDHLKWKTDISSILPLYFKWIVKENAKIRLGYSLYEKFDRKEYHLDTMYNYLDFDSNVSFINNQLKLMYKLFNTFEKVIVIRVPVKEESVTINNKNLINLKKNYEQFWNKFIELESEHIHLYDLSNNYFSINDYHQYDTHWNVDGNEKFANIVTQIIYDNNINL